ncbi:hypothetical protein [Nocardioides marmoraquaticus]
MDLLLLAVTAADPVPDAEDVKAGWLAFWIFVALAVATGLLLWSLTRQLRKTRANAERGVFDPSDPPKPGRRPIPPREEPEHRS